MNPVPILRLRSLVRNFMFSVDALERGEPGANAECDRAYFEIQQFMEQTKEDLPSMTEEQAARLDRASEESDALLRQHVKVLRHIVEVVDELAVKALKGMGD